MPVKKTLSKKLSRFIEDQKMFFVATAARDGRVNLSPKGMDSLRLISDTRLQWLNLSGSGNETAAHIREVPRMTLMFCAFDGPALILRVYGTARVIHPRDPEWETAIAQFPVMAGSRQVFDLEIDLVQTSCGTGVPLMSFEGQRGGEELVPFFEELGQTGVEDFWRKKNVTSIDGRPTGIFRD